MLIFDISIIFSLLPFIECCSVHFHNQTTENYVLIEVKGKLTTHPYLITLQGNIICQDSLHTFHCLNKDLLFLTGVLFIHQYTVEDATKCSCQGQSTGLCLKKKRYHLQGTMSGWSVDRHWHAFSLNAIRQFCLCLRKQIKFSKV